MRRGRNQNENLSPQRTPPQRFSLGALYLRGEIAGSSSIFVQEAVLVLRAICFLSRRYCFALQAKNELSLGEIGVIGGPMNQHASSDEKQFAHQGGDTVHRFFPFCEQAIQVAAQGVVFGAKQVHRKSPNLPIDRILLFSPSGSSSDPVKKETHSPKTIERYWAEPPASRPDLWASTHSIKRAALS